MLRKTIIIAGALAVLAAGADRVAGLVAERRLADRLHCLAREPSVAIGGFPFLTQLATGTFRDVRVTADDVTEGKMTLRHVAVEAHGVRLSDKSASSVDAEAVVGYDALPGLPGTPGGGDDGRLTLRTTTSVRGINLPVTVFADLAVDGARLTVTPAEVELGGLGLRLPASHLPAQVAGPRTVGLPALPAGLAYREISAHPDGLHVTVAGSVKIQNQSTANCGGTP